MNIIEKRKKDRFRAEKGAVVEFSKPRFFNLGKPRVIRSAPIVDISKGGLAFEYRDQKMWSVDFDNLSIALPENEVRIDRVPIKIISDKTVGDSVSTVNSRRCGVKFSQLSIEQKSQLLYFINHHTRERQPVHIRERYSSSTH